MTISDTEQQSNFNGYTQGTDSAHNTARISNTAFNFAGQQKLSSISSISITLTIFDGDTGFGPNGVDDTPYPPDRVTHGDDDDFINTLHLQLSGFDTGQNLLLNGFDNYDQGRRRNNSAGLHHSRHHRRTDQHGRYFKCLADRNAASRHPGYRL